MIETTCMISHATQDPEGPDSQGHLHFGPIIDMLADAGQRRLCDMQAS